MIEKTWPIMEQLILNAFDLTEQLYRQLTQETEALKNPAHIELIDSIAANKKQLVVQLEQFNMQCGQVLEIEKLPNNQTGIKEYFKRAEAAGFITSEAAQNWAKIQLICSECKAVNEQNGASIELLAYHTKRSLQILKGKPHSLSTYGQDGAEQSTPHTRTLMQV